jgi:hypothetical protein
MISRRCLIPTLLVALALPATAAHADDVSVGPLAAPTPIRAYAGTAVLSLLDPATNQYRLATMPVDGTAQPQMLPGLGPALEPLDADIGPGPDGTPVIVYSRCVTKDLCHLYRTTPAGGTETEITGASSTGGSESSPTVWGSRIVFARSYRGHKASQTVYARPLDAGIKVRSTRLPAVPARECEGLGKCYKIKDGTVSELELRGTTLAESVRFGLRHAGICGAGQVRLVDTYSASSRLVAKSVCGLSGQTWVGLSLTPTQLLFSQACAGDPAGCGNHGAVAYRYTLKTHRFEHAPQPSVLSGFTATDADHALEVREPDTQGAGRCDNFTGPRPACQLVLAGPLPFVPGKR